MKKVCFLLSIASIFLFSCQPSTNDSGPKGRFEVRLTDNPFGIEELNIDLKGLEYNTSTDPNITTGWVSLPLKQTGIINILAFTNGKNLLLVDASISPVNIKQLRLILGENNSAKVQGFTIPAPLAAAAKNGKVVSIDIVLGANGSAAAWLDIVAEKSVTQTGPFSFELNPFLRAFDPSKTASIEGFVLPADASPFVTYPVYFSSALTDTIHLNALPDATGYFKIVGLNPALSFPGGASGQFLLFDRVNNQYNRPFKNVNLTVGSTTNAGTTTLTK